MLYVTYCFASEHLHAVHGKPEFGGLVKSNELPGKTCPIFLHTFVSKDLEKFPYLFLILYGELTGEAANGEDPTEEQIQMLQQHSHAQPPPTRVPKYVAQKIIAGIEGRAHEFTARKMINGEFNCIPLY